MADTLRTVLDIELAGERYRLAVNGKYSLHRPKPADAFGVVAHEVVDVFDASGATFALLQLYGAAVEENERLKAALQKGG